jgi:hypothetical protein
MSRAGAWFRSASRQFPMREFPLNVGMMIETEEVLIDISFFDSEFFRGTEPFLASFE